MQHVRHIVLIILAVGGGPHEAQIRLATVRAGFMDFAALGRSGLKISRIVLGCMSYGDPAKGTHPWALDEAASRPFLKAALDAGINAFDTANVYSHGASEEILGRALRDYVRREEVVIATKVHGPMRRDAHGRGLSRKAIFREVEDSLRRLGTDYIDLYQIHRLDPTTPLEETLEALNDLVRTGKVLYLGASSMAAWEFMKALSIQRASRWATFISMQNHYSLLYREEEREMMPLCLSEGVGAIPWSPLARGRLTRPWERGESTARMGTDRFAHQLFDASTEADRGVVDALERVAARLGRPMAQVALAWNLGRPAVVAPIVGVTRLEQLRDAIEAASLTLDDQSIAELEEPYRPHLIAGF